MKRKAVLLFSGGLDSATVFALARNQGYEIYALSLFYGQRHKIELKYAKKLAQILEAEEHKILKIDSGVLGSSALTDKHINVPKHKNAKEISKKIPVTYVPARNTIFLSFALAYAETISAFDIFIGVNALDYSGYPDCRPEYITAYEKMANLATARSIKGEGIFKIHTPLINLTKAEIIKKGLELDLDYSLTTSCYDPDEKGRACGKCDSCLLRLKGFSKNGIKDPAKYV